MTPASASDKSGKVVIRNIGLMLSGDLNRPILDADTIVVHDGLLSAVGRAKECDTGQARPRIAACQPCVAPGLIDTHVHPVPGDSAPRQNQPRWIDSSMHG